MHSGHPFDFVHPEPVEGLRTSVVYSERELAEGELFSGILLVQSWQAFRRFLTHFSLLYAKHVDRFGTVGTPATYTDTFSLIICYIYNCIYYQFTMAIQTEDTLADSQNAQSNPETIQTETKTDGKLSPKKLIIILFLSLIFIGSASFIGYLYLNQDKNDSKNTVNTVTTEEESAVDTTEQINLDNLKTSTYEFTRQTETAGILYETTYALELPEEWEFEEKYRTNSYPGEGPNSNSEECKYYSITDNFGLGELTIKPVCWSYSSENIDLAIPDEFTEINRIQATFTNDNSEVKYIRYFETASDLYKYQQINLGNLDMGATNQHLLNIWVLTDSSETGGMFTFIELNYSGESKNTIKYLEIIDEIVASLVIKEIEEI